MQEYIFDKNNNLLIFYRKSEYNRYFSGVKYPIEKCLIYPTFSICLSQGLSHACISINFFMVKLRMAHYNGYSLLERFLLDNRSKSRANTFKREPHGALCLLDVPTRILGWES